MPQNPRPWVRILALCSAPLALLIALVAWGFSSPVGSSADEDFHLASIWCGQGPRDGLCEVGSDEHHRRVPLQLITANQCFDNQPTQSAACPSHPADVLTDTDRGNFFGVYPPGFYAVMSVFASAHIAESVLAMRAFNALLYVSLLTALFLLLPMRRRGLLVWSTVATLVPFGVFLIPSVNPSGWGVMSATTLWLALLGYFESVTRAQRLGLATVATLALLLGTGSRADAAAYAAASVVIVGVLTARRSREWRRLAVFPAVLGILAVVAFFSAGQANAVNPGFEVSVPNDPAVEEQSWTSLLWNNLIRLPELWAGAFGAPVAGRALWLGTTVPGLIWVPALLVVGGLVFGGLRRLDLRKVLSLGAIAGMLVALPMLWLMRDHIMVGQAVQARYLYPLLIMIVAMSLLGFDGVRAGLTRVQLLIVATTAAVGNIVIQWVTIRRFVTGLDAYWVNLDLGSEWWWPIAVGPTAVWIVGSLAFAVFCALCAMFGLRGSTPASRGPRPDAGSTAQQVADRVPVAATGELPVGTGQQPPHDA